jgi:tripartite-type tricarboxylate transporter receptor subunit TctC
VILVGHHGEPVWSGLFAPAGPPAAITAKLFAAVTALQASGRLDALMKANAGEVRKSASPRQFNAMVAAETGRYGKLMQTIGMRGDLG